ncbi:MAG: hypothetical protein ACR2PG_03360 [Hyphomicrobiaceae bacterium]
MSTYSHGSEEFPIVAIGKGGRNAPTRKALIISGGRSGRSQIALVMRDLFPKGLSILQTILQKKFS